MKPLKELFYKEEEYKYYEYYVKGSWHRTSRTGETVKIWHIDGTFSVAYMCGEKYYTYDLTEKEEWQAENRARIARKKERAALMKIINEMSTEELKALLTER